jgi:hypothetical protein
MALLDDTGQPIFPEFSPPSGADAPPPDAQVEPTQNPNAPSAAAPPVADFVPTGTIAEPHAATPDPLATDGLDDVDLPDLAPEPQGPNWDAPDNPWRQEAERARQQAEAANQTLQQMQAHALSEADRQSKERQRVLMQQRVMLDSQVGDYSPEDFQRRSYALNQQIAAELQRSEASKQAVAEHFGRQQEAMVWDQSVAQAYSQYGLTPEEVNYVNQYAKDTEHLDQLARQFKSQRDEKAQLRSVTQQLAKLKADQQTLRSNLAAKNRENGADRTGGVGGAPVPTPAPTSPLGLLRMATTGDPNKPLIPR